MTTVFKQTIKKISKAGFFRSIEYKNHALSFKHSERVFSLQLINGKYYYRSGYVMTGKVLRPTFESDYQTLALCEVSQFNCDYQQRTDNPAFVLRQSMYLIGFENF